MKLFQTVKKYFILIGFGPNLKPFNLHQVNGICLSTLAIASSIEYLNKVAQTTKEYTNSLYIIAVAISIVMCYVNVIF